MWLSAVQLTAFLQAAVNECERHVVEAPPHVNSGPDIEKYQHTTGNRPPAPWCCSFVCWCISQATPTPPLPYSGSCQALRVEARRAGRLRPAGLAVAAGDLVLLIDVARDHAHHIGVVTGPRIRSGAFPTIEGNTNPAGGREGYGVFARHRGEGKDHGHYEFIHIGD